MDIVTEDMQSRRDRGGWWRQDEMEEEELQMQKHVKSRF